jgi:hypothetical protein
MMVIRAVLSIDDGKTLRDDTTFEVRPEIGEKIAFWKDGREPLEATVISLAHHQSETGYFLTVEASTNHS